MNCTKCNAPLEANMRFCARCGEPVSPPVTNNNATLFIPTQQPPTRLEPPTMPLSSEQTQQNQLTRQPGQFQAQTPTEQAYPAYAQQPQPDMYRNTLASNGDVQPRRRRRGGCLTGTLITLVLVLVLLSAGWFFALRPYLHGLAQTQIDQAFTTAVQQMPPQVALAQPGPFTVSELSINNLIQLNFPPNDYVKQVVAHITPTAMRIDFLAEGMQCAVTGVPSVQNGQLVATNVNVQGIAALIMSNDEMTAILNRHLAEAQAKLHHPILGVQLEEQKMILLLGPPNGLPIP